MIESIIIQKAAFLEKIRIVTDGMRQRGAPEETITAFLRPYGILNKTQSRAA